MVSQLPGAAPAVWTLDGLWGGDRLQLTIDVLGARLETDGASGSFSAPLRVAKDGRFVAAGHFSQHQPGPDLADAVPATAATDRASFAGEIAPDGLTMSLSIQSAASAAPQIFCLRKGVKVKLIRCL
ncbi:hypothetical protein LNV09_05840 [Paucibacter sp. B2R-40]|uniref:hypothetical protein n=1 Tax=Paucibacter sp. B2R-40 TaxID=2893554 RepID=UPI0021E4BF9D|nr:hypothetical protein [Paucibacter sp. B2R-40]MCV2353682.1 hypothetical protein [Paucibacter sp. B2R-40]